MENNIEKNDVILHKDISLQKLNTLLSNYINSEDTIDKADKLAYWIEDYCNMLSFENDFKPHYLKSYSRGDILKVNLGYNIGNEEGGLHYCIVIDKKNSIYSGIITVIPLTSAKGKKLHYSEVNLGNEVYLSLKQKIDILKTELTSKMNSMNLENIPKKELSSIITQVSLIEKIDNEMSKMKKGSIALVSQITTISKQKIYDPQHTVDILSGVRISDNSLDLINNKIKQLFVKM